MEQQLVVPAPAKINLFLHVVGRRANDGYHLLESAMALVRFGDTLVLTSRRDGEIVRTHDVPGVAEHDDLSLRAARTLRAYAPGSEGVAIALTKRIPTGAGLGGGSSDAASVLLALNQMWKLHLPRRTLMEIGLTLGADVPFFIFGRAALARGVGERLTPLSVPTPQLFLAKPLDHAPTPLIFSQTDLVRETPTLDIDALAMHAGRNDLQPVAERLFPSIADIRNALGRSARMSGSGACVFVLTHNHAAPPKTDAPWQQATQLLARHPLYSFAPD
jgi:4-diphosphocytidyl-2-C-methyl-D-erythritol kinase